MNAVNANRALVLLTAAAWLLQGIYLILPLDLIPDFIPVLGLIDDLFGLSGTMGLTWYTVTRLQQAGEQLPDAAHEAYEPLEVFEVRAL